MNRRTRASSQGGKKPLKAVSNSLIQKKAKVAKSTKKKIVKAAKAEVKNVKQKLKGMKEGESKISYSELQELENEGTEASDSKGDCENKTLSVLETDKSKVKRKEKGDVTYQTPISVRLTEQDAGISEYISNHSGFSGIIKQRYSDFHVNEIDKDGNIVTLTSTDVPVEKSPRVEDSLEYLKSSLPGDLFKKLVLLFDSKVDEVEIEATDLSKDARRKLHMAVLNCGKSTLMSNTVEKGSKKYITVKKKNIGKPDKRSSDWPSERGGDYVHFALHKENMDTMETVNIIAGKLRIRPSMITYAGTKDRRAKTTQLMSVRKIEPSRLAAISRGLKGIELGNYRFQKYPLELGDLKGNRFHIVLRNVKGSDQQIEQAITSLKTKGFINYYGLQRFGTSLTVPTYEIGKALLQGQWQKAVELILKPRREEESCRFLSEARKIWWETKDASSAFKVLRNKNKSLEGKLLLGLSRSGAANYLSALDNIPRNTRLMYLHSYQSLLWNKVVSRRIKEFGLMPLVGDLVLQGNEIIPSEPDDLAENVDHDSSTKLSGDQTVDGTNKHKPKVAVLSEANLSSASIFDVVLPLPGHDIEYPRNEIGLWFEELLHKDGLSSAKLKQTVKTYSLGGTYRKMVVCPTYMNWKIMHYSDPQTTLVLSDLEQMQKIDPPKDVRDGVYKALLLDFCLPSSTYATMAIREILKIDTSCYNQSLLNDYHLSGNSTSTAQLSSPVENCQTANENKSCQMEIADTRSMRSRLAVSSGTKTRQDRNSSIENEGEPDKKKQKMLREKSARLQSNRNDVKGSQLDFMRTRRASVESKKIESNVLAGTNKIVESKLSSLRSTSRRSKLETNLCRSVVGGKRIKNADVSGPTRKEKTMAKCKKLNVIDKTKTVEVKTNERRSVRNVSLKNVGGGTKRKIDKVEQVNVKSELKMGLRRRSVPVSEPDVKRLKSVSRKTVKITPVKDARSCKQESEKRISRSAKTKASNLMKNSNQKANQGGILFTEDSNISSEIKTEKGQDTKDLKNKSELECGVGPQNLEKEDTIGNSVYMSEALSNLQPDTVKLEEDGEMGNTLCNSLTSKHEHIVDAVEQEVDEIKSSNETEKLDNEDCKVSSSTTKCELECVASTQVLQKEDTGNIVSMSKASIKLDREIDTVKLEKEGEMGNTVCSLITSVLEHVVEVDKSNIETEEMHNADGKANMVCSSGTKSEVECVVATQTQEKEDVRGNTDFTLKSSCEPVPEIVDTVKLEKEGEMGNTVCTSIASVFEHGDEVHQIKSNIETVKLQNEASEVNIVCSSTVESEVEHAVDKLTLEKENDSENTVSTLKSSCTPEAEIDTVKLEGESDVENTVCSSITSRHEHMVDAGEVEVDVIKSNIETQNLDNEDSRADIVCSSTTKTEVEHAVDKSTLEKDSASGNVVSTSKSSCEPEAEIDTVKLEGESVIGNVVCSSITSQHEHMVDAGKVEVDVITSNIENQGNEDNMADIVCSSTTKTEVEHAVDKLTLEKENASESIVSTSKLSCELEAEIDTVMLEGGRDVENTVCSSITSQHELMVDAGEVEVDFIKSNIEKENLDIEDNKADIVCSSTTKAEVEHAVDKLTLEKENASESIVSTSKLSCELEAEIDTVMLEGESDIGNTVCTSITSELDIVKLENEECRENIGVNTAIMGESVAVVERESDGCLPIENSSDYIKPDSISGIPDMESSKVEGNVDIHLILSGNESSETSVVENINVFITDTNSCKQIVGNKLDIVESPVVLTAAKHTDSERVSDTIVDMSEECNDSLKMPSKHSANPRCDVLGHNNELSSCYYLISNQSSKEIPTVVDDTNKKQFNNSECGLEKSSCDIVLSVGEKEIKNSTSDTCKNIIDDNSLDMEIKLCSESIGSPETSSKETVVEQNSATDTSKNIIDDNSLDMEIKLCSESIGSPETSSKETVVEQNSTTDTSKNIIDDNSLDIEIKLCNESIRSPETAVEQKVEISQAIPFATDSLLKTQPSESYSNRVSTVNENDDKQRISDLNTSVDVCKGNNINAGPGSQESVEIYPKSNISVMESTKDSDQNLELFKMDHKCSNISRISSCDSDNNVDKTVTVAQCEKPEIAKHNADNEQNTHALSSLNPNNFVPVESPITPNSTQLFVLSRKTEGEVELFEKLNVDNSKNFDNSNNGKSEESELDSNNLKSKNQCIINNTNLNKTIPEASKALEISSTHNVCQILPKEVLETVESVTNCAVHWESPELKGDGMQTDNITSHTETVSSHSEDKIKTASFSANTVDIDVCEALVTPMKSVVQLKEEMTESSGDEEKLAMLEEKCFNEQIQERSSNSLLVLEKECDVRKVIGVVAESDVVSSSYCKNDMDSHNKNISQISDSEQMTSSVAIEKGGCSEDKEVLKDDLNSQTHLMEIDPLVEDECVLNPKEQYLKNESANICLEETILGLSESTNVSDKIGTHEMSIVKFRTSSQILASETIDIKKQIGDLDNLAKCDISAEAKEICDLNDDTKRGEVIENMDRKLKENFSEPINEASDDSYHQSKTEFKEVTRPNPISDVKNKDAECGVQPSIPNKTCAMSSVVDYDACNALKSQGSIKSAGSLSSEHDVENSNINLHPQNIKETSKDSISNVSNIVVAELCDRNCTASESIDADSNKSLPLDVHCDNEKIEDPIMCSKLLMDSKFVEGDGNAEGCSSAAISKIGTAAFESKLESDLLKSNKLASSCAVAENENSSDFSCENSSSDITIQLDGRKEASCPDDFKENISVVLQDSSEEIQHDQERKVMDISGEYIPAIFKDRSDASASKKSLISEMVRKENELSKIPDRCTLLHEESSISAGKNSEASNIENLKQEDEIVEVKSKDGYNTEISTLSNKGCYLSTLIVNEQKLIDTSDEMSVDQLDNSKDITTTTHDLLATKRDGSDADIFEQSCPSISENSNKSHLIETKQYKTSAESKMEFWEEKYGSSVESCLPDLKVESKDDFCVDNKKIDTESNKEVTEEILKSNENFKLHSSDLVEDSIPSREETVESDKVTDFSELTAMENKIQYNDSKPEVVVKSVGNVMKSVLNSDMSIASKTQEVVVNSCCEPLMSEVQNVSILGGKQNSPQNVNILENTKNMPNYNHVKVLKSEVNNEPVQQDSKHDSNCDSTSLMGNISMPVQPNNTFSGNSTRPGTELTDLCIPNDTPKIKIEVEVPPSSAMNNDVAIETDISTSVNNELVKPFNPDNDTVLNDHISQSSEFADVKSLEYNLGKCDDIVRKENVPSVSETSFCSGNTSKIETSCLTNDVKVEHLHSCTLNEEISVRRNLKSCNDTLSSLTCSSTDITYDLNTKSNLEGSESNIPSSGETENLIDANSCKDEICSDELSEKMQETGNKCDTKLPSSSISVSIFSDDSSQRKLDICPQSQSNSSNADSEKESPSTNKLLHSYQIVANNEIVHTKETVQCIPREKEFANNLQSNELHNKVSSPSKSLELKTAFYKCISGNSVEDTECITGEAVPQAKNIVEDMPDKDLDRNESINCLNMETTTSVLENTSCSKGETIILSTQDEINKSFSDKNNDFMLSEENSTKVMSTKESEISENVTESEDSPKTPPSNIQNQSVVISLDTDKSEEELKLQSSRPIISSEQIPYVSVSYDSNLESVTSLERNTLREIERLQDSETESKQKLTYSSEHSNPAVKRKNEDSESEVKRVKVTGVSIDSDPLIASVQTKRKVDVSDLCGSIENNGVETKKLKESYK